MSQPKLAHSEPALTRHCRISQEHGYYQNMEDAQDFGIVWIQFGSRLIVELKEARFQRIVMRAIELEAEGLLPFLSRVN